MARKSDKKLTILALAHEGIGHVNAVLGLAEPLQSRGHQIVFVTTEAVAHLVENRGFKACEYLKDNGTPLPAEFSAAKLPPSRLPSTRNFGGPSLKMNGILSGLQPLEKMINMLSNPFPLRVLHSVYHYEESLQAILTSHRPDLILTDHFIPSPALVNQGVPWVYVHSSSALYAYDDPNTPPPFSGYASTPKVDAEWAEFKGLIREWHAEAWRQLTIWYEMGGYPAPIRSPNRLAIIESPYLNVYQYPAELDYLSLRPRPSSWISVDTFGQGRSEPAVVKEKFILPETFTSISDSSKIIYFSLGTLGCFDTELMRRLLGIFAHSPHRYIVSKGSLGGSVNLPDNMVGANYLPQVELLQAVQLVITHGGNNTFTETFAAGVPMIVMPLFADQYDNGRRVEERGYGRQVNPYTVEEGELLEIIDDLLNDEALMERLRDASKRIRESDSLVVACERIEALV